MTKLILNGLNTPIKRHTLTHTQKKKEEKITQLYTVYKKLTSNIGRLKVKGWKKIYHTNINQEEAARNERWFSINKKNRVSGRLSWEAC